MATGCKFLSLTDSQLPQQSGVPGMNFSYNINEETTEIQCEINEDLTEEAFDLENVENTAPVDNSVVEFDDIHRGNKTTALFMEYLPSGI